MIDEFLDVRAVSLFGFALSVIPHVSSSVLRKQKGTSYVLNIATVCGTGKDTTSWQREMIRFDEASGFIYLFFSSAQGRSFFSAA